MVKKTVIAHLLPVLLLSNSAFAQIVTCRVSAKFSCDAQVGCRETLLGAWNDIDMSGQTYSRCDIRGCDKYDANFSRSGTYIVIDVPGRGLTAKLADDLSAFLEVATIGMQALVSFGACQIK